MDPVSTANSVVNTAKDIKKSIGDPIMRIQKATAKSSITRMTKDQIFNFPLFMDSDIDNDDKFPIIKCIEKNYASIVMMAITNEGFVDRNKYESISQFLKKFHNNDNIPFADPGLEGDITVSEAIASEGYMPESSLLEMWDCVEEQLDTESINDMYLPYQRTVAKLSRALEAAHAAMEADDGKYFKHIEWKRDKNGRLVTDKYGNTIAVTDKNGNPVYQYVTNDPSVSGGPGTIGYGSSVAKFGEPKTMAEWKKLDEEEKEKAEDAKRHKLDAEKDAKSLAEKRISDRSKISGNMIKDEKFNALTPTILKMTLANANSGAAWTQELMIGIRAMPRMIPQSVMVENMVDAVRDRVIFKFIKWTKGEIKWADLFFGIGSARSSASTKVEKRWMQVLRKRGKRANSRWMGSKMNPNTTIIITEADAALIQSRCGVDIHEIPTITRMMSKYFLLGFGIYDNDGKMLKMIYDGENEFNTYSLRTLSVEAKKETDLLEMNKV